MNDEAIARAAFGPFYEQAKSLDMDRLRTVIHELRWCKASDLLHAIAHDEDDEDGYRARLIEAWSSGGEPPEAPAT
jgi:hypothetical protein